MKKTSKIILMLLGVTLAIIVIRYAIIAILLLISFYPGNMTYISAKNTCEKMLNSNYEDFSQIAEDIWLKKEETQTKTVKIGRESVLVRYEAKDEIHGSEDTEYVRFEIDAQGMLGGQYWGLLYIPTENYLGKDSFYIYDEFKETGKGNNMFARTKLNGKWFFYYDDWDGHIEYVPEEKAVVLAQEYVTNTVNDEYFSHFVNFDAPKTEVKNVKNQNIHNPKTGNNKVKSECWIVRFNTDLDGFLGSYKVYIDFCTGEVYGAGYQM